jgi:hypothetical protein
MSLKLQGIAGASPDISPSMSTRCRNRPAEVTARCRKIGAGLNVHGSWVNTWLGWARDIELLHFGLEGRPFHARLGVCTGGATDEVGRHIRLDRV